MPVFNLNFVIKKTKQRAAAKTYSTVVESRITGILVLTENGEYFVKYDNCLYPITKKSYDLSNEDKVFVFNEYSPTGITIVYLNSLNKLCKTNFGFPYMPFAPAYEVKGSIIKDIANNKYFDINKILLTRNDEEKAKFQENKIQLINNYNERHRPKSEE